MKIQADDGIDRRTFLETSALLGATAAAGLARESHGKPRQVTGPASIATAPESADCVHSVCLQCNTGCGIRVHTLEGVAYKIDGQPYSPWTLVPPIPYATSPADSMRLEGTLCPKGQAGVQTANDPYRLVKVLKRDGPRGSQRWKSIPFDQAIEEVVEGGRLFAHLPGEEERQIAGLRELWALRDPKLAADMATAVQEILAIKGAAEKKSAVEAFKERFRDHLGLLIDPDHPDLGPRNNQVTFAWGRLKGGRAEFIKRFINESFGSTNAHGHTTVCQGSLYFTGKAMSDQFVDGKFTGGQKFYWQADTENVEFLLAIGSSYIEGGYGPTHHARKLMESLVRDKVRIAVVDPRFSKIASKAWKWVPAKPGTEGALALGMIRWIIEQNRFDERFLSAANKAAAKAAGEQSWTNASWLVKEDGSFLRASEAGLGPKEKRTSKAGQEWEFDAFVALVQGKPTAFDPNDEHTAVTGDLLVTKKVAEVQVKSAFQLLYESSQENTLAEWASICGIDSATIVDLAREFTSHGKRAVADPHRGVSQHTNGFYNVLAVYSLNALVGNWDWKGGLIKATTYGFVGDKQGQPFDLTKLHPSKFKPFGLSTIRHDAKYEDSTLFAGYPAKRNWYPFSSDVYQEILPSIADAYPYPTKVLFLYMAAPTYALPGGQTNIRALLDTERLPLVIASDVTVGETSMYADYIFPDLTYLERWEFHGSHPSIAPRVQPIRNPAIAPIPETVQVYGAQQTLSLEAMILGFAERLGLPGFGPDGLAPGMPLVRPEDLYLRMVANVAAGDMPGDAVPDADEAEIDSFERARRGLPETVFNADRWREVVGPELWKKVVYVLNRGGRFQDYSLAFDGERFTNSYGKLVNIYLEKYARSKSPMTGKKLVGIAKYLPIADVLGRAIDDGADGFDLQMITYREITQTKSRTAGDYWLNSILDTNHVLLNTVDADRLELSDGDRVRITSKSNPRGVWELGNGREKPMIGEVKVIEGIRPGVMAFSLGRGHWANGSSDMHIDGVTITGDARRATGVHGNAAMRLDDHLGNTCLIDPVGGSVSFYDTRVRLVKEA
jgi:anaerobic selenocysteine-containing dehydrogenase